MIRSKYVLTHNLRKMAVFQDDKQYWRTRLNAKIPIVFNIVRSCIRGLKLAQMILPAYILGHHSGDSAQ